MFGGVTNKSIATGELEGLLSSHHIAGDNIEEKLDIGWILDITQLLADRMDIKSRQWQERLRRVVLFAKVGDALSGYKNQINPEPYLVTTLSNLPVSSVSHT